MSWFNREVVARLFRTTSRRPSPAQPQLRARLRVDSLEDRTVPAVGDMFTDAVVLSGTSVSAFVNTADATGEVGEPNHAGAAGTLNSVWFKWTAPQSGTVEVNTFGSGFDTVLAVYTGTELGNLREVASNDDTRGVQSQVTFDAVAGTTYYIAVDGYDDATGDVALHLAMDPANDDFADALAVTSGTYYGSNRGATGEAGEPDHAGVSGPINSVWYKWTAPADGTVSFDTTGSNFDTVMGVYTGDTVAGLTLVGANDDFKTVGGPSQVTFQAHAGVTYYVAIDGYSSATGDVQLNVKGVSNAPPVVRDQAFGVAENSAGGTAVGVVAATDDAPGALTYEVVGGSGAGLFNLDRATGALTVADGAALDYESTASYFLIVRVTDAGGLSTYASMTVNLTDVNDAPVLDTGGGPVSLGTVNAGDTANQGVLVADLIAGRVGDQDAGATAGIAVVGADNSHGSWQFSLDGGATWAAVGSVSDGHARLLSAGARVRFVADAAYSGTVADGLTFRAWDQTAGSNGGFADATAGGGSSAFSAAALGASVTVQSPPTIARLLSLTRSLLTSNVSNSLGTSLTQAQQRLNSGNVNAAVNGIQAYINQVQALVRSGRLSSAVGQTLICAAQETAAACQN